MPALMESARMRMRNDSTFRRQSDLIHASNCPARMMDRAIELWHPRSVLDVGCGTGKVIDYLLERGISDVRGLEGSRPAIESAKRSDLITQADLSKSVDLKRKFDLVYSVEVAEHIPASGADSFVETCVRHGDRVIFTAARPGQGGLGHLNEQEPQYWIAKFATHGFALDEAATADLKALKDLFHENLMVAARRA
jgi:SAM-dependent methyltransferase